MGCGYSQTLRKIQETLAELDECNVALCSILASERGIAAAEQSIAASDAAAEQSIAAANAAADAAAEQFDFGKAKLRIANAKHVIASDIYALHLKLAKLTKKLV